MNSTSQADIDVALTLASRLGSKAPGPDATAKERSDDGKPPASKSKSAGGSPNKKKAKKADSSKDGETLKLVESRYDAAVKYANDGANGAAAERRGLLVKDFYKEHLHDAIVVTWNLVAANRRVLYKKELSEPNVMLLLGFGSGRGVMLRIMRFPARLPSFQDVKERMEQLAAHVVGEGVGPKKMNQVIRGLLPPEINTEARDGVSANESSTVGREQQPRADRSRRSPAPSKSSGDAGGSVVGAGHGAAASIDKARGKSPDRAKGSNGGAVASKSTAGDIDVVEEGKGAGDGAAASAQMDMGSLGEARSESGKGNDGGAAAASSKTAAPSTDFAGGGGSLKTKPPAVDANANPFVDTAEAVAAAAASTAHTAKPPSESNLMAGKSNGGTIAGGKTAGGGDDSKAGNAAGDGSAPANTKPGKRAASPSSNTGSGSGETKKARRQRQDPDEGLFGDLVLPPVTPLVIVIPSSLYCCPPTEAPAGDFADVLNNEMVQACIRQLKCLTPIEKSPFVDGPEAGWRSEPIEMVPAELLFQRSERGHQADNIDRPDYLALALFVGHLAEALGIEPEEVQDKIFLLTCLQMTEFARFSAQQNQDQGLREEQKNLKALFAQCPIYILFGTSAAIVFDEHTPRILDRALPRGALTYPPPQIARPAAYPENQANLIRLLWDAIGVPGPRPTFLDDDTPKETLREVLHQAMPNDTKRNRAFLLGKYARVPARRYEGGQLRHRDFREPTHWTYDWATQKGGNEGLPRASYYGSLSGTLALQKDIDFTRSGEVIVYPLPEKWFGFNVEPPPFGRVYFTQDKRDNKGPPMIDLWLCETWDDEARRSNRDMPTRDAIKAWGPPPRLRKGEVPCPSRSLKELCRLISRKEMTTYTNDKQVFRVDFVFSLQRSAFVPLAVMGLTCHTDWAAERPPPAVYKESAAAAARLIRHHFKDKTATWPA